MNLRECRLALQLSQRSLANQAALSQSTIRYIEENQDAASLRFFRKVILALRKSYSLNPVQNDVLVEFLQNPLCMEPFPQGPNGGKKRGSEKVSPSNNHQSCDRSQEYGSQSNASREVCRSQSDDCIQNRTLEGQAVSGSSLSDHTGITEPENREGAFTPGHRTSDARDIPNSQLDQVVTEKPSTTHDSEVIQHIKLRLANYERYSLALTEFLKTASDESLDKLAALDAIITRIDVQGSQWESLRQLKLEAAKSKRGTRNLLGKVIVEICANMPHLPFKAFKGSKERYVRHKLSSARWGQEPQRERNSDNQKATRKRVLFDEIEKQYFIFADQFKKNTQDASRTLLDRKLFLRNFYDSPEYAQSIVTAYGSMPKFDTLYNDARKALGKADPHEDVKEYFAEYRGYNADYAGQCVGFDGTGYNLIRVKGEKSQAYEKRMLLVAVDDASGYVDIWTEFTNSESRSWPNANHYFLGRMGFIPEVILADRGGGIRESLNPDKLQPGWAAEKINNAALLAYVSAGAQMYIHKPRNPRGKARTEAGIKQLKKMITRLLLQKAMKVRTEGETEKYAYEFESQEKLNTFIKEAAIALNNKEIRKSGKTRNNYWMLEDAQTRRAERAIVDNWQMVLSKICQDAYVSRLAGNVCKVARNGKVYEAELTAFRELGSNEVQSLPQFKQPPHVLTVPLGILKRDQGKDGFVALVMEPRKGQARFFTAEATKIGMTAYGERDNKGAFGEFHRITDSTRQMQLRKRQKIRTDEAALVLLQASLGKLPGEGAESVPNLKSKSIFDIEQEGICEPINNPFDIEQESECPVPIVGSGE